MLCFVLVISIFLNLLCLWISLCRIHWCIFSAAAAFTDVYFQLLQHSLMFPAVAAFTDVSSCCSIHWCCQLLQHSLMFPAVAAFTDVSSCCSIHWRCHLLQHSLMMQLLQPTVDGLYRVQHHGNVIRIVSHFPLTAFQKLCYTKQKRYPTVSLHEARPSLRRKHWQNRTCALGLRCPATTRHPLFPNSMSGPGTSVARCLVTAGKIISQFDLWHQ